MRTNGNLLVLNCKQAEIWKDLYEAAEDFFLGDQHDEPCQRRPGMNCDFCLRAVQDRHDRLIVAIKAASPELERVKDIFGPYKK